MTIRCAYEKIPISWPFCRITLNRGPKIEQPGEILMQMEGIEPKELSRLYGELIAFEWIEQNTGQASVKDGVISNCYRITLNGLREFRKFNGVEINE